MSFRWCGTEVWTKGASSGSSSSSDYRPELRGSAQNSPRVARKQDVNITKLNSGDIEACLQSLQRPKKPGGTVSSLGPDSYSFETQSHRISVMYVTLLQVIFDIDVEASSTRHGGEILIGSSGLGGELFIGSRFKMTRSVPKLLSC
ncbi:hypothetical protein AVEN_56-1 [Araneus ventricosus]|uniref:Uncharacterized protein n=1 Tax=Araneus ventricosus TaxID=182803 RepID=A0A4Y2HCH1_ARAVE|nr:hypothetical protein AVEN_56-1 [Araneus ventricosus]